MSLMLPVIDVSSATVGSKYSIPLNIRDLGDPSNPNDQPPTLQIANESGCGFAWQAQTEGDSGYLQAGKWMDLTVIPGEVSINLLVVYVLNNPPVSQVQPTYFYAGETPDPIGQLGNSPISGSTATSLNTLSNEGNAAATKVIDLGDTAFSNLVDMYAGGQANWAVDQSGVKHQVFNIQAAGNPLQLGQAADITEVLGQLKSDQLLTAGGNISVGGTLVATQNGSTSGNAKFYMDEVGTLKRVVVVYTTFKQGAAILAKVVLPVAFAAMAHFIAGDINGTQVFLGAGTAINVQSLSGIGTFTSVAQMTGFVFGDIPAPFDTLQIQSNSSITHNGVLFIVGN